MLTGCVGLPRSAGGGRTASMGGPSWHRAPVVPPPGFLFTMYKAPLMTDFDNTPVGGLEGTATTHYFHIPGYAALSFAFGDNSVATAAKDARIETVNYADYEFLTVLGIYSRMDVNVYGE